MKKTKKEKKRLFFISACIIFLIVSLISSVANDWTKILENKSKITELNENYNNLLSEEEKLLSEVTMLFISLTAASSPKLVSICICLFNCSLYVSVLMWGSFRNTNRIPLLYNSLYSSNPSVASLLIRDTESKTIVISFLSASLHTRLYTVFHTLRPVIFVPV